LPRFAPLLLAAALLLAGCGENADDAAVRQVVTAYLKAFAAGDGAKACSYVAPDVRRSLGDCPARLDASHARMSTDERNASQIIEVDAVTTAGANARARLTPGDSQVALRKVGGKWMIAGVPG
jgi:hypothetical protein